jgi:DNA-binding CsgD family transcriptional regulator
MAADGEDAEVVAALAAYALEVAGEAAARPVGPAARPVGPAARPVGPAAAVEHFIAAPDALEDTTRSVPPAEPMLLAICPVSRSSALLYLDLPAEAAGDGRRPLSLARELGPPGAPAALDKLSPRERELVTLVAQGRTDAQIAAQLVISVRTVVSHLDRIRDKTGHRRRADLTRLALGAGLV